MCKFLFCFSLMFLFSLEVAVGENHCEKAHSENKGGLIIQIDPKILHNADLEQVVKKGEGRFDSALAMNVHCERFPMLREKISSVIGRPLTFYKQWNPEGEAHITVIAPVEYYDFLRGSDPQHPILTMNQIGSIASKSEMQKAKFEILSMGSGKMLLKGKMEETFFIIVKSESLLKIRRTIHEAFVQNGGKPEAWNPEKYYPHITVGFTLRDLHEADGVIKDVHNSSDSRFIVKIEE
ncbi:MAG: hypothetical protein HQM08_24745 [Candidatus Riflebacteria bacterium]|nr:hypothetical protein [Candidatus Riflebacteria bacterium]